MQILLTSPEKELLSLLQAGLFHTGSETIDPSNLDSILKLAWDHAVFPLVYPVLDGEIEEEDRQKWKQYADINLTSNMRVSYAHCDLHHFMTDHHIPYVTLKGCASAAFYPEPLRRPMGDVDFYVDSKDFEMAKQTMIESGYTLLHKDCRHHFEFDKEGIEYELHYDFSGIPEGDTEEKIRGYLSDIVEKSTELNVLDGKIIVPSPFHHGLIMILHFCRHLFVGGIGLRHLCDWAVFAHSIGNEFSAIFEKSFKEVGLWEFARIMTATCQKYLGLPVQMWVGEVQDNIVDGLIADIIHAGNFGNQRTGREAWLTGNINSGGLAQKSVFRQMVKNCFDTAKLHWPLARKCKVISAVGAVYYVIRFLILRVFGKREKLDIKHMMKSAGERRKLYEQFRLFIPEE